MNLGVAPGCIARKGRIARPARGEAAEPAERKRLDHRFFQPLARGPRLGRGGPAIAQHVAKLVAELVSEFGPIGGPDVNNYLRDLGMVVVEPHRWWSVRVIVDVKLVRLPIGEQPQPFEAHLAHSREHAEHGVGRR